MCMFACACACACACVHVCMCACVHVQTCVHTCVCARMCVWRCIIPHTTDGFQEAIFHPAVQADDSDAQTEPDESPPSPSAPAVARRADSYPQSEGSGGIDSGAFSSRLEGSSSGACGQGAQCAVGAVRPVTAVGGVRPPSPHICLCSTGFRVFAALRGAAPEAGALRELEEVECAGMLDAVGMHLHGASTSRAVGRAGGVQGESAARGHGGGGVDWERGERVARLVKRVDERVVGRVCEDAVSDAVRGIGLELD